MGLRMETGFFRIMSKNGLWWFLHADLENTQANLISDQSGINRRTLSLIMANNTALDDLFSVRWWETLRRQRLQSVKI